MIKDVKAVFKLKSGDVFETRLPANKNITLQSFTKDTVHYIVLKNGDTVYFQGDQVAYLRVIPE